MEERSVLVLDIGGESEDAVKAAEDVVRSLQSLETTVHGTAAAMAETTAAAPPATAAVQSFGQTVSTVRETVSGFLAATALRDLFRGLSDGIGGFVRAAEESEDVQSSLQAALNSTGGAAGMTLGQLNDLADSLAKVSRFSDETIGSGEALLLSFTNIGSDVFPKAIAGALDMSQALGQGVTTSAMQLGKALNDPIEGISALRRAGVQFTDDQEAVIARFVRTGDVASAQLVILDALAEKFGGRAAAAAENFGGSMDQLHKQLDKVNEAIGGGIIAGLSVLPEPLQLIAIAGGSAVPILGQLAFSISVLPGALGAASAALVAFRASSIAAFVTNPVTLAVVLLALATWQLITHWDEAKEAASKFGAGLRSLAADAINPVIDGVNMIIEAWNRLPFTKDIDTIGRLDASVKGAGVSVGETAEEMDEAGGSADRYSGAMGQAAASTDVLRKMAEDNANALNLTRMGFEASVPGIQRYQESIEAVSQAFAGLSPDELSYLIGSTGAVGTSSGGTTTFAPQARATGGPVEAGRVYRINEYGREYFRPGVSGDIIPVGGSSSSTVDNSRRSDVRIYGGLHVTQDRRREPEKWVWGGLPGGI